MSLSDSYRSAMSSVLASFDQERKAAQAQENLYKEQYGTQRDRGLKDSYINYMQGKRDLPQMLSYLGYSGGPAESSTLKLNTSYEQGRQDKETSYLDAIKELTTKYMGIYADINSRRAQAQAQYEAMIAQAAAEEAAAARSSYGGYGGYRSPSPTPETPGSPTPLFSNPNYDNRYAWSGYGETQKALKPGTSGGGTRYMWS